MRDLRRAAAARTRSRPSSAAAIRAMQEALTLAEFASKTIIINHGRRADRPGRLRERIEAQSQDRNPPQYSRSRKCLGEPPSPACASGPARGDASQTRESPACLSISASQPATRIPRRQASSSTAGARCRPTAQMRTELKGVSPPARCAPAPHGRAAASAGDGATAAIAADQYLRRTAQWRSLNGSALRLLSYVTACAERIDDGGIADSPRSARISAQGRRQAPRAAAAEPRRQDASIWSTACSTTPKSSWIRCGAGSPSICPPSTRSMIKPRESWVDDPDMRAKIEADADAAILGVGL